MIESARLCLWLGVGLCAVSGVFGWRRHRPTAMVTLGLAAASFWIAVTALAWALVRSDLSVTYVVDHSRETSSWPYRLAGLWGGMAGSLLLWTAILAAIVFAMTARSAVNRATHVVGVMLVGATGLTVALAADPFNRLQIPAIRGRGLTPILEHPAMLIHPPILYTGLLLTVTPFLLAVDSTANAQPIDAIRRSVRTAALLIGIGLVLGASWAYAELGWGGYWAWDPVENAALMPWLALLAWLHAARSAWARPRLLVALATLPLLLVFLGAWITRAGLTVSVHAFAETRGVGFGFAALMVSLAVVAIVVTRRTPGPAFAEGGSPTAAPASIAALLLFAVLLGTGYPVVRNLLTGDNVIVEASFFSRSAWPLAVGATAMSTIIFRRLAPWAAAVGFVVGFLIAAVIELPWFGFVLLATATSAAVVAASGVVRDSPRRAVHVAHLGFAVMLFGVAGTTGTTTEAFLLAPGERAEFRGAVVDLRSIDVVDIGSDRISVQTDLRVGDAELRPARVAHSRVNAVLPETDTDNRWNGDLQAVLRDATDGLAVIELRYRPLAGFIWWGAAVMLLGLAAAHRRPVSDGEADQSSTEDARAASE